MTLLLPYEVWRDIKGYEGKYQISARGRVKSLAREWTLGRSGGIRHHDGMILNPGITRNGYKIVGLCKNGGQKTKRIHVLVAQCFIHNPDNKPFVNHIDANKLNNDILNLEWCTPKENTNHAWMVGKMEGVRRSTSKRRSKKVIDTRTGQIYPSILKAATLLNLNYSTLRHCINGSSNNNTGLVFL